MTKLLASLLVLVLPALAANDDWNRVRTARPGERIWIDYMRGDALQSAKAEMVLWAEDALTVRIRKTDVTLARTDIRKIRVYAGKSRAKGAGIGAAIGAASGIALMGVAVAMNRDDLEVPAAPVIVSGGSLFAAVGALIGVAVGSTKTIPLYEIRGK